MTLAFPEPGSSSDVKALFLVYLDYLRRTVAGRVSGLSEADVRATRLPSGGSPIELVKHLIYMERRWLIWGFLGAAMADPWGDERDGHWHVAGEESLDGLLTALGDVGDRTRGNGVLLENVEEDRNE